VNTLKEINKIEDRNVISFLETVDVHTGKRIVVAQFDSLIEAPNWTRDGKRLIYNSLGRIYSFDIATKEVVVIDSDYAHHCNNDHVLSPDNSHIAVSHHTQEDGQSRIYIFPMEGVILD